MLHRPMTECDARGSELVAIGKRVAVLPGSSNTRSIICVITRAMSRSVSGGLMLVTILNMCQR